MSTIRELTREECAFVSGGEGGSISSSGGDMPAEKGGGISSSGGRTDEDGPTLGSGN